MNRIATLIEQARNRSSNVSYEKMDLTDKIQLSQLAQNQSLDHIVCSMVLHDMSNIYPFFESLRSLIKPRGSFIFSIPHPCFNSPSIVFEPAKCITVKDYIRLTI